MIFFSLSYFHIHFFFKYETVFHWVPQFLTHNNLILDSWRDSKLLAPVVCFKVFHFKLVYEPFLQSNMHSILHTWFWPRPASKEKNVPLREPKSLLSYYVYTIYSAIFYSSLHMIFSTYSRCAYKGLCIYHFWERTI